MALLAAVLCAAVGASASAERSEQGDLDARRAQGAPPPRDAAEDAREERDDDADERDSAEGKAERARSRSAHADLDDAAARDLATRTFEGVFEQPAWAPLEFEGPGGRTLLDGVEVEAFLGEHAALLQDERGKPAGLVESTLPLRTGEGRRSKPVDLSLEREGSFFEPGNSPARTRLGVQLDAGLRLDDIDVSVRPAAGPDAEGPVEEASPDDEDGPGEDSGEGGTENPEEDGPDDSDEDIGDDSDEGSAVDSDEHGSEDPDDESSDASHPAGEDDTGGGSHRQEPSQDGDAADRRDLFQRRADGAPRSDGDTELPEVDLPLGDDGSDGDSDGEDDLPVDPTVDRPDLPGDSGDDDEDDDPDSAGDEDDPTEGGGGDAGAEENVRGWAAEGKLVEGRPFYANVATDTDFFWSSVPGGAEAFWQLRSARSPESFALEFELANGAELREAKEARGAVEVVRDDEVLARISPPAAVDAEGKAVEVSQRVEDGRLEIAIDHRNQQSLIYPLLLDPVIVEDFVYWDDGTGRYNGLDFTGWRSAAHEAVKWRMTSGQTPDGGGLYVTKSLPVPQSFNGFEYGEWIFDAPGTSYAFAAEFLDRHVSDSNNPTCGLEGIYSYVQAAFETFWQQCSTFASHYGRHCVTDDCSPLSGSIGNTVAFGAYTPTSGARSHFYSYMFGANVYLYDRDLPSILAADGAPSDWVGFDSANPDRVLNVRATDTGLGVKRMTLTVPREGGSTPEEQVDTVVATHPCAGDRSDRCPATWQAAPKREYQKSLPYRVDRMPEGVNTIKVTTEDILGNVSAPTQIELKIDRSGPLVGLGRIAA